MGWVDTQYWGYKTLQTVSKLNTCKLRQSCREVPQLKSIDITMLKFRQLLLLTLAMGVLINSAFCRRSRTSHTHRTGTEVTGTGTGTGTETGVTCTTSVNVTDLSNFVIQSLADIIFGVLAAVGLCIPLCTEVADCILCFAESLPPPPVIPSDLVVTSCE